LLNDRLLRYMTDPNRPRRIGELLIAARAVTEEQVAEALRSQKEQGGLLGQILVERGSCTTEDVCQALSRQVRFSQVDLGRITPQPEALQLLPRDVCRRFRMFPFEVVGSFLCLAMVNVLSKKALVEAERIAGLKPKGFKATEDEILAAIDRHCPEE